jgi:hypothetical protein
MHLPKEDTIHRGGYYGGGAELPVTNTAAATALVLNSPGKSSPLRALVSGSHARSLAAALGLAVSVLTIAVGARGAPPLQEAEDKAREGLAAEEE